LRDHIWGVEDVHVGDTSVSKAIGNIRRVIGDDRTRSTVIETVQGRGYRFIAVIKRHLITPLQVFRVITLNRWPYEEIQPACTAELDDRIHIVTNLKRGTKYRWVPGPAQGIEWGLLSQNINDGINEDKDGNDLVSDDSLLPKDLWIQITYQLFGSTRRKDDTVIAPFRNRVMTGNYLPLPLASLARTPEVAIGSLNDPYHQWYEMGDPPSGPETIIFASSISHLEYINAHTIPHGVDYEYIQTSVVDLRSYRALPTYEALVENFDHLHRWYQALSAE
jgi:hypothetical protein